VQQAQQARQAQLQRCLAQQERQALQVQQAQQARQAQLQRCLDLQERQAQRVPQVQQAQQAQLEPQVQLVQLVQLEQQALLVLMVAQQACSTMRQTLLQLRATLAVATSDGTTLLRSLQRS